MFVFTFQENKLRTQDYAIKIRGNDYCQQTADDRKQTTCVRIGKIIWVIDTNMRNVLS